MDKREIYHKFKKAHKKVKEAQQLILSTSESAIKLSKRDSEWLMRKVSKLDFDLEKPKEDIVDDLPF